MSAVTRPNPIRLFVLLIFIFCCEGPGKFFSPIANSFVSKLEPSVSFSLAANANLSVVLHSSKSNAFITYSSPTTLSFTSAVRGMLPRWGCSTNIMDLGGSNSDQQEYLKGVGVQAIYGKSCLFLIHRDSSLIGTVESILSEWTSGNCICYCRVLCETGFIYLLCFAFRSSIIVAILFHFNDNLSQGIIGSKGVANMLQQLPRDSIAFLNYSSSASRPTMRTQFNLLWSTSKKTANTFLNLTVEAHQITVRNVEMSRSFVMISF